MAEEKDRLQRERMNKKIRWAIAGLICLGLAATGLRMALIHSGAQPPPHQAWVITLTYHLLARKAGAEVTLATPWDSPTSHLYNQQLTLDGLRLQRTRRPEQGQRRIEMAARHGGRLTLRAAFSVHQIETSARHHPQKTVLQPEAREQDLAEERGINVDSPMVQHALEQITAGRTQQNQLPERIFDYVREHTTYNARQGAATATRALSSHGPTTSGAHGPWWRCAVPHACPRA